MGTNSELQTKKVLKRKKTKHEESDDLPEEPAIIKKSKKTPDLYVPTKAEIDASVKVSDKKQKSKRQLKREKNEARINQTKELKNVEQNAQILNYLSKWKHSKDQWKFEKKKNVYIFHNILDSAKIPETVWNTVLEYVQTSSGNIRKKTIEDAMKVIEIGDKEEEEIDSVKYQRARTLLQFLGE